MKTIIFKNGPMDTNSYISIDENKKECFIIDPASSDIINHTAFKENKAKFILLTHGHIDHIEGIPEIVKLIPDIPIYAHIEEKEFIINPAFNLSILTGKSLELSRYNINYISENNIIDFNGIKIQVIHTPGHTPGSVCYFIEQENTLFSGDTLFKGSIGRTDFPGGDFDKMQNSLKKIIKNFKDETIIYPGHGINSVLKNKKKYNPYLTDYAKI